MKKDTIIWILLIWVVTLGCCLYAIARVPKELKVISVTVTPTPYENKEVTPTPSKKPTEVPTEVPTATPTPTPTMEPTPSPTPVPTLDPTPTLTVVQGQTEFKSYERYTAITRKSSDQYKLQQIAYTGDYGIRMVDGRYCVALGSRWSVTIGEKLDVLMDDGTVIPVILGDCKQDRHTDPTNSWGIDNGDVLEFIVDEDQIPPIVRKTGSFGSIFVGKISNITKAE